MTLNLWSLVFQEKYRMRALGLKLTASLIKFSISLNGSSHQSGKWLRDTQLHSLKFQELRLLRLFIQRIRTLQLHLKDLQLLKFLLIWLQLLMLVNLIVFHSLDTEPITRMSIGGLLLIDEQCFIEKLQREMTIEVLTLSLSHQQPIKFTRSELSEFELSLRLLLLC